MLLCADSHGRGLAWSLNRSQDSHGAVGFIKPGGRTEQVLDDHNIKGENLMEEDVLIIMCGTNDVAKNEANLALNSIRKTLNKIDNNHQVVLVDLPKRYDMVDWSCINAEVKKTNDQIKHLSESFPNVTLVEASKAERHLHTRHGMHLNGRGKRWLGEQICLAVKNFEVAPKGSIRDQRGDELLHQPASQLLGNSLRLTENLNHSLQPPENTAP